MGWDQDITHFPAGGDFGCVFTGIGALRVLCPWEGLSFWAWGLGGRFHTWAGAVVGKNFI